MTCVNNAGSRSCSCNVQVIDTPAAPTGLEISHVTKRSVTLHWRHPENIGGSNIRNYIVEKRMIDAKAWTKVCFSNCQHTFLACKCVLGKFVVLRLPRTQCHSDFTVVCKLEVSQSRIIH